MHQSSSPNSNVTQNFCSSPDSIQGAEHAPSSRWLRPEMSVLELWCLPSPILEPWLHHWWQQTLQVCLHVCCAWMLPLFVFRYEERRNALANLIKMTREGEQDIWTEHFKTILLMLLETLDDQNVSLLSFTLTIIKQLNQAMIQWMQAFLSLSRLFIRFVFLFQ